MSEFERIVLDGEHIGYVYPVNGSPWEWLADTAVRGIDSGPQDWSPSTPFASRGDAIEWAIRRHAARATTEDV